MVTFVLVCCCGCLLPQVPLGPNYRVPHMLQITNGHWTPEAALTRAHELVTALVSSKLGAVAPLAMLPADMLLCCSVCLHLLLLSHLQQSVWLRCACCCLELCVCACVLA